MLVREMDVPMNRRELVSSSVANAGLGVAARRGHRGPEPAAHHVAGEGLAGGCGQFAKYEPVVSGGFGLGGLLPIKGWSSWVHRGSPRNLGSEVPSLRILSLRIDCATRCSSARRLGCFLSQTHLGRKRQAASLAALLPPRVRPASI